MKDHISKIRLAKAVAITALVVMCVPAVDALADSGGAWAWSETASSGAWSRSPHVGIDSEVLIGDGEAYGFLSRLEEAASIRDAVLPKAFEREIGLPNHCRDLRVSEDGAVVSCIVDAPPGAAGEVVRSRMIAGGWCEVPLGSLEGATYVKLGGECTWTLVTCTEVGAATNIVYRCVSR